MTSKLLFLPFEISSLAQALCAHPSLTLGQMEFHLFPDQEIKVQISNEVENQDIIVLASLNDPNAKILPLLFLADTLKDLGAKRVGLCAPYLAYMRQDKAFHRGEGISSKYFAKLISQSFDWVITVDPHLHRWHNLKEIFSIPAYVLHANGAIANWIAAQVENPLIIGPDEESQQWVQKIGEQIHAPVVVLRKTRQSDTQVKIAIPEIAQYQNFTPVIIDDIISTAQTMCATIIHLKEMKMIAPICVGVHAIFAEFAYQKLLQAGATQVVSCNTITHPSNAIDLSQLLLEAIFNT